MAKKTEAPAAQLELTPEEIQAVIKARENSGSSGNVAIADLAAALTQALEAAKPPQKKTPFNRTKQGFYDPKDGKPKPKLRRAMFHHGLELQEALLTAEEIELLNKVKPGSYCGGHIRVIKRKDRSLDIDYPIRTASQRLKLVNAFGIRSLSELCQRLIEEASHPEKFKTDLDDED